MLNEAPSSMDNLIPWHLITKHITITLEDGVRFQQSSTRADEHQWNQDLAQFARAIADQIAQRANSHLDTLPRPGAPSTAWEPFGVTADEMFPNESLAGEALAGYHDRKSWELIYNGATDAALVIVRALAEPEDPFRLLPPLVYLAQNARIQISILRVMDTSGNGDTGLDPVARVTLRNYLALNIMHRLYSHQPDILATAIQSFRWEQVDISLHELQSNLHSSFQQQHDTNESVILAYSNRCFDIVSAWYAVVRTASERDVAIVLPRASLFREDALLVFVGEVLAGLGEPFQSARNIRHERPTSDASESSLQLELNPGDNDQHSIFLQLPVEIHERVYSHLPPNSLFPLVYVCKRLHDICVPRIYADPQLHGLSGEPFDTNRLERVLHLVDLLENRRPDLYARIRCACVMPPSLYEERCREIVSGDQAESNIFPPLEFALSSKIEFLTELTLYAPVPCYSCTSYQASHPGRPSACELHLRESLLRITERWPSLATFSLVSTPSLAWHLSQPTLSQFPTGTLSAREVPAGLVSLKMGSYWEPAEYNLPRHSLSLASTSTLQRLVLLNPPASLFTDSSRPTPVFPQLLDLVITLGLGSEAVDSLLQRSFSTVVSLSIEFLGDPDLDQRGGIHLSASLPRLRHLRVSGYEVKSLPSSTQTIAFNARPGQLQPTLNSSSVQAVLVTVPWDYIASDDAVNIGTRLRQLRSLEVELVEEEKLDSLPTQFAESFPHLEVIILRLDSLSYRPQRTDVEEIEDGKDEEQRRHAERFFKECPALRSISFNGIPAPWSAPGHVPGRVWRKELGAGGSVQAVMVGREILPWMVSEYWSDV